MIKVELNEKREPIFQRIYICLHACKEGFKTGCRPLVGLDGCHVKGPHPGQVLFAVGIDGNNQMFAIAYAIVELECKDSWSWFINLLMKDLAIVNTHSWTFITDKQKVTIFFLLFFCLLIVKVVLIRPSHSVCKILTII